MLLLLWLVLLIEITVSSVVCWSSVEFVRVVGGVSFSTTFVLIEFKV